MSQFTLQFSKKRVALVAMLSVAMSAFAVPVAQAQQPTCGGLPATIVGTDGEDDLVGTDGDDVIVGLAGFDRIWGRGGNDIICGNEGNDDIFGGPGDDLIGGGPGEDTLRGNKGNDALLGGTGNDVSRGGEGADFILSGFGFDINYGGAGSDQIFDMSGNNTFYGGAGDDVVFAGEGEDTIRLGKGIDLGAGGAGHDEIFGGAGADWLVGEAGDDRLFGAGGPDMVVGMNGVDLLRGGVGDDLVVGGFETDTIDGMDGSDVCDQSEETENPAQCEEVLSYSLSEFLVDGRGEGDDPTGSGFGDPYFAGAEAAVFLDEAYPFAPLGVSIVEGAQFPATIPNSVGVLEIFKEFATGEFGYGAVEFDENSTSPLEIVMSTGAIPVAEPESPSSAASSSPLAKRLTSKWLEANPGIQFATFDQAITDDLFE